MMLLVLPSKTTGDYIPQVFFIDLAKIVYGKAVFSHPSIATARVCIHVALQERAAQLVGKAGVEIALLLRKDGNAGVVGKAGLALRGAWVFFVVTSSSTFICADS